ncbi:MAG: ATP-binding protein [Erysipelotrichaceae bacterium]
MLRQVIKIDKELCNGCRLCVDACHEGAIDMVDGKAQLMRDDYCDGLGDCLPSCPTGAISFETREAAAFDEAAVKIHMEQRAQAKQQPSACPGSQAKTIQPMGCPGSQAKAIKPTLQPTTMQPMMRLQSQLQSWPVQIKLVPIHAPYFQNANLLIAADCTAFAYANFHQDLMKNKVTIIGCPKLDEGDYVDKLTAIIAENNIKSVTVARMEVPCCGGLSNAAIRALQASGKMIPWHIVTISTDGELLED